jgi:hypothetical protein
MSAHDRIERLEQSLALFSVGRVFTIWSGRPVGGLFLAGGFPFGHAQLDFGANFGPLRAVAFVAQESKPWCALRLRAGGSSLTSRGFAHPGRVASLSSIGLCFVIAFSVQRELPEFPDEARIHGTELVLDIFGNVVGIHLVGLFFPEIAVGIKQ